ncbi:5'-nucleotidase C-terminal domain-containing protein [Vagococcus lutrae]|uniref:bifunctional metallophosphatase/5'-nucleotidase n=1 Tax=Vagococcus lutrae TaxID=81947 RepID=UPI00200E6AAD|nr:bifunctional metallophosphatase/5'-nucleotidase [Vagococcus lutrae]UQF23836.1 5'-nucleotidase C-terminal domain-containing protein [Vagococcus lutrae]UQF64074.1 5'-nucleotidase C-terminal domain-containing protein [Vagococcus lutrae]
MSQFTILHTNDLHSHLAHWPAIRRFLNQRKQELEAKGHTVLTVDLGDFSDRIHPLTEATSGQANVQLMNQVAYDYATIGNNEGLSNTKDELNVLYQAAEFEVVLANLSDCDTQSLPDWAKSYAVYPLDNGLKLGVVGLTAPFPFSYKPAGWCVQEACETLTHLVPKMLNDCDEILLLSHLGKGVDDEIARAFPMIKIILGSHTHHLYERGKWVGETLIAAAGKFGYAVGEVTAEVTALGLQPLQARTYPLTSLPTNVTDEAESDGWFMTGNQELQKQTIGYIDEEWDVESVSSTFCQKSLEIIQDYAQADISLLNTGLFLKTLPKGKVTRYDLHQSLPHPMHLVRIAVKGTELVEVLDDLYEQSFQHTHYPMIGMGFRGKVFGDLAFRGVTRQADGRYFIHQQPLEDERVYTMVMVDHFIFIPFFPLLTEKGDVTSLCPSLLREVIGQAIRDN